MTARDLSYPVLNLSGDLESQSQNLYLLLGGHKSYRCKRPVYLLLRLRSFITSPKV